MFKCILTMVLSVKCTAFITNVPFVPTIKTHMSYNKPLLCCLIVFLTICFRTMQINNLCFFCKTQTAFRQILWINMCRTADKTFGCQKLNLFLFIFGKTILAQKNVKLRIRLRLQTTFFPICQNLLFAMFTIERTCLQHFSLINRIIKNMTNINPFFCNMI